MALLHENESAWNRRSVLFVHGIGFQPVEYSEPLYEILRREDPDTAGATRWYEVVYDKANEMMKRKVRELENRLVAPGDSPAVRDVGVDFLADLFNYLVSDSLYHWINTYVKLALVEALKRGQDEGVVPSNHEVILIAHSLGTVVSYEVLHGMINDAQVPGLSSGVSIRAWLTMGSPLAFIKANESRIPSFNNDSFLRRQPLDRPRRVNTFTGEKETNVRDWFNFRQVYDPVASLVPVNHSWVGHALSQDTYTFAEFHTGANPHDFGNYITEYRTLIMELLRGQLPPDRPNH